MESAFERLGLERRLGLDDGALRAAFDRAGGGAHPDAGGDGGEFARVREAYDTLRSPAKRLRHWLETGGVAWEPGGGVPPVVMELFGVVGDLVQRVDALAGRKAEVRSALARSMLEREGMALLEEVEGQLDKLRETQRGLVAQFEGFEATGAGASAGRAMEVARTLAFLEKWERQLRERWAGLAA